MKTFKVITNSPFDTLAPESYWIQESSKVFFGLFTRRKIIGQYRFDNGGAMSEMPYFCLEEALERVETLRNNQ